MRYCPPGTLELADDYRHSPLEAYSALLKRVARRLVASIDKGTEEAMQMVSVKTL